MSKVSWIRCSLSSFGTDTQRQYTKTHFTSSQRCLWSNNYEFNVLLFAELSEGTVIADGDGCEQRRETQASFKLLPPEDQVLNAVTPVQTLPHGTAGTNKA